MQLSAYALSGTFIEETQGYVDFQRDHEVPVQVLNRSEAHVDDSEMNFMTCLFYSESIDGHNNSLRAGRYGLADSKCEGQRRTESGG